MKNPLPRSKPAEHRVMIVIDGVAHRFSIEEWQQVERGEAPAEPAILMKIIRDAREQLDFQDQLCTEMQKAYAELNAKLKEKKPAWQMKEPILQ
jgi:hypothetical protein